MTTAYEVPLSSQPQTFLIALGGTTYRLRFQWNKYAGWMLDLLSDADVLLRGSIPLVTGVDLLKQHTDLAIAGQLVVETDHDLDAVPTFDNLGTTSHLYFLAD